MTIKPIAGSTIASVLFTSGLHAQVPVEPAPRKVFQESAFSLSVTADGDLERDGSGEVQLTQYQLSHLLGTPLNDRFSILGGVFASYTDLDLSGDAALPDHLQNFGITLGGMMDLEETIGEGWSAKAFLRPGFASGSSGVSGSDFNLTGSVIFEYQYSSTLGWEFGLGGNLHGDLPVMPRLGVEWKFAPEWMLTLGVPETGVAYQLSSAFTLRAGVRVQGGTYHIDSVSGEDLDDTWLEHREIRAGLGVDYKINAGITLSLDGGVVVDRSFDYFDEDYEVEGDTAAFMTLGIRARF